ERLVVFRKVKRNIREEDDFTALQLVAIPGCRLRRRSRYVHGDGGIESCHDSNDTSFCLGVGTQPFSEIPKRSEGDCEHKILFDSLRPCSMNPMEHACGILIVSQALRQDSRDPSLALGTSEEADC